MKFEIVTPKFERSNDMQGPGAPPSTMEEWNSLREMNVIALREMGLHKWDKPDSDGKVLMLFPGEWYPHIPMGFKIESITSLIENIFIDENEVFIPGETDDDTRFGCLAYGVRVIGD